MKYISYSVMAIVTLISLVDNTVLSMNQALESQLAQNTASKVYSIISNQSIATFSINNLIENGIKADDFKKWTDLTNAAHAYLKKEVELKRSAQTYSDSIAYLNGIRDFVYNTINQLHVKYGLGTRAVLNAGQTKTDLELIKSQVNFNLSKANSIIDASLDTISKNTPIPDYWKKSLPADRKQIFVDADKFFKDWNQAKKLAKNNLTDKEFDYFLRNEGVKDAKAALSLVDKLDKLHYRLEQENKASKLKIGNSARNVLIAAINELKPRIIKLYPDLGSSGLQVAQFGQTNDKASSILLAESGAMSSVLKQLLKEIDQKLALVK